jgi:hypothetical protein
MAPKLLSQWADENGIPRRTAYNWAKSGKLNVALHRTLTGRLVVLDAVASEDRDAHPFVAAYAEALGLPISTRERHLNHSRVLEAWGTSLYNAVTEDLRPAVLQLAVAAACGRTKADVAARFSDWIGRVELADWYIDTGIPEAASFVVKHGEIRDKESFRDYWPTCPASLAWSRTLDGIVEGSLAAAGRTEGTLDGAAEALAENGLIGLDNLRIAVRRAGLRQAIGELAEDDSGGEALPDRGELWDLRALYSAPMWSLARPASRRTARVICDVVGWDPASPLPPEGHRLHEVGLPACINAAVSALVPHEQAAHVREIDAFRRIALGRPFEAPNSGWNLL